MKKEPTTEKRTRARSKIVLAALVLGGLVVGVALAEVVVWVFDLGPDVLAVSHGNFQMSADPVLRYELKPGSVDGPDRISEQGLRDQAFQMPKPEGKFRIAVVGDSIAYGYGLSQEQMISRQLERRLHGLGMVNVEVLNFGVTAYNIEQVVEQCESKVADADADLIVYIYCLNDPQDYSFEWETLRAKLSDADEGYLHSKVGGGGLRIVWLLKYALAAYGANSGENSEVARDPGIMAIAGGDYVSYFRGLYNSEPADRLMRGLDALANEVDRPVLLAIFPVFEDLDAYALGDLHQLVAESADARGLEVIDLLPAFQEYVKSGAPPCWLDGLHPDDRGVQIACDVLADKLVVRELLNQR